MKNIFVILCFLMFAIACKQETAILKEPNTPKEPIAVNPNPDYKGNVGSVQGNIMGNNLNAVMGADGWRGQSYPMRVLQRDAQGNQSVLPYLYYYADMTQFIKNPANVFDIVQTRTINIYFEGIAYEDQSFEFLKQKYVRGKKFPFKPKSSDDKEGLYIDWIDWDIPSNTTKSGSSGFGDQTGSTWEILDSQEVPVSENAKQAKMTNALAITSLINCKLYRSTGLQGEIKNLKIQMIMNYRRIEK
jgi:hypothetical protein